MTGKQQAIDAALAQIDAAFGKTNPDGSPRVSMKVWMDPFTEERMFYWLRDRIECSVGDEYEFDDKMWESIRDDIYDGEPRVLDFHPFDRMYPPVTLGERIGLFLRRLFGRWQLTESEKLDRELAKIPPAPPPNPHLAPAGNSLDDPPF